LFLFGQLRTDSVQVRDFEFGAHQIQWPLPHTFFWLRLEMNREPNLHAIVKPKTIIKSSIPPKLQSTAVATALNF